MKKLFTLSAIFLLILSMATSAFAVTTTMEIVEDNICTINLNDSSSFEKKIIDSELQNHQVTLQLKISNNSNVVIPSGELILVIDSSNSMNTVVSGTTTRKDIVLNSANELVENLLAANSTSLQIGVVTFSTSNEIDPTTGFLNPGTEADAQKVCDFSNNLSTLQTAISGIEGTGQYTNLDSGLQLAKSLFSAENNNKYMIILTDGLPNIALGYNDLVTYDGLTNIINKTKSTLNSLNEINVITMLTGIDNEEATFRTDGTNTYTYGQVINQVFGTEENPTIGKFYNVNDAEIEQTITNNIYRDLLPVEQSLKNISVVDYFPQYIVDNFEMTYVEGTDTSNVSANIDTSTNSITWTIAELAPGKTATIQYNLKLKDEFDETIIDKILDTNEKVDITFNNFDGTAQEKSSDVTPKIKLIAEPTPEPKPEPKPEPPVDDTVAPEPLPDTGSHILPISIILLVVLTIFFGYKARKIK